MTYIRAVTCDGLELEVNDGYDGTERQVAFIRDSSEVSYICIVSICPTVIGRVN